MPASGELFCTSHKCVTMQHFKLNIGHFKCLMFVCMCVCVFVQHSWNLTIDLVIGPEGISQQTENSTVSSYSIFVKFFLV